MRIENFRAGYATNSSSSHSVVIIPDTMAAGSGGSVYAYGWDNFVLTTPTAKIRYLTAQLIAGLDDENAERLRAFIGRSFPEVADQFEGDHDIYVDHQSQWARPRGFSEAYTKFLIEQILSPNVVILGGNDNGDEQEWEGSVPHEMFDRLTRYGTKIKTDGPYAIVFEPETGNKVRLAPDDAPAYTKASTPELVDLKITDFCGAGCAMCYQSSTTHGKHAPLSTALDYVDRLHDMGVFEIAIGGGEPTDHPDFMTIMGHIDRHGMVANFTTMSDRWLEGTKSIWWMNGGVGVSVHSEKGLELARTMRQHAGRHSRRQIQVQHVVGSVPVWVTTNLVDAALKEGFGLLLLGFKDVGFGADYKRHDIGDFATHLALAVGRYDNVRLSIDTALNDQHPDIAQALGAPEALITSPEGKFSCYIDAVDNLMGASSYVPKSTMDPIVPTMTADHLKTIFARY